MRVLISGASVAGPTLAHWLAGHGHVVTVVDVAPGLRDSGYPIDVRGPAVEVAERMGVLDQVRALSVDTDRVDFVGARGTVSLGMRALRQAAGVRDLELLRGDLVRTLYDTTKADVEYRFGDSVRSLVQDDDGVSVEFEHGAGERFDIVVGADGLHSNVRRLAFGPAERYSRYLGCYVGVAAVDPRFGVADRCVLYNVPGRAAGVYRFRDTASAIFLFRSKAPLRYDHRDTDEHKRLLVREFAGSGRQVADLLADALTADDFYFDSVSQIRMPRWSRGRVVLVGDAGYGPALLSGAGTTLAMVGAYRLAGELSAGGSPERAFARYQAAHRPLVTRSQRSARSGGAVLVPASAAAIRTRDLLTRLSGPPLLAARLSRYLPRGRTAPPDYPAGVRARL
jgi:2-polyprenyl-6-methoxyphenol hydroxylase-like FAD-dependent oxidoreductase